MTQVHFHVLFVLTSIITQHAGFTSPSSQWRLPWPPRRKWIQWRTWWFLIGRWQTNHRAAQGWTRTWPQDLSPNHLSLLWFDLQVQKVQVVNAGFLEVFGLEVKRDKFWKSLVVECSSVPLPLSYGFLQPVSGCTVLLCTFQVEQKAKRCKNNKARSCWNLAV